MFLFKSILLSKNIDVIEKYRYNRKNSIFEKIWFDILVIEDIRKIFDKFIKKFK